MNEGIDTMDKITRGQAFVLGDDIDTDQIIPAEYLTLNPAQAEERRLFGRYALSGVPKAEAGLPDGNAPFVEQGQPGSKFAVIVAGRNFGCGSSREHAPLAIAEAGCHLVVAESYARIFYRNSVNGGYLVPVETSHRLVDKIATGDEVEVDIAASRLTHVPTGEVYPLGSLGDVAEILAAGGLFDYAAKCGMLPSR